MAWYSRTALHIMPDLGNEEFHQDLQGFSVRDDRHQIWDSIQLLWHRFDSPQGIAAARAAGGDAARGEAIAFFDCYVKPLPGWAQPALNAIRQSPRSVVLPALRDLETQLCWYSDIEREAPLCILQAMSLAELEGEDGEISGPHKHFDNLFTWEAETVQLYFDPEYVSWPYSVDQGNVLVFATQWWQAYIKLQIIQSPGAQELVALYTLTCESKTRSINASNLAFADKAVPQNSNFAHS
eukprot:s255_g29.t1